MNVNGLGLRNIQKLSGGSLVACAAGDVVATVPYLLIYNGTAFVISSGSGGSTSPLTTKGDLWGYSTVNARIPVGADGTVLMADSAQALGVRWASGSYTAGTGLQLVGSVFSADFAVLAGLATMNTYINTNIYTNATLRVPNSTTLPATCTTGDSYMDTDATSGSRWYLCESANTWVVQGGGTVPVTKGGWWPWGATNYAPTGDKVAATGAALSGFSLVLPPNDTTRSMTTLRVQVATPATNNCGGGASACGMKFSIHNSTLTSSLCKTVTGSGGGTPDINTGLAVLNFTFNAGSAVSGGVCTLPASTSPYYLIGTSDSTAVTIYMYGDINTVLFMNTGLSAYEAGSATGVGTGSGASLDINQDLSGLTWSAFSGSASKIPAVYLR